MNTPAISSLGSASPFLVIEAPDLPIHKDKYEDVTLLHTIASRLAESTSLTEELREVVDCVSSVVRCDSCFVYLLEGDELILRASNNRHQEAAGRVKMKVGPGVTGWLAKNRKPVAIADGAYQDPRFQLFNGLPEGMEVGISDRFEGFLSVPVLTGERLVGVINSQDRTEHQYSEREISLIATLGFLLGAEIERARLETENAVLLGKLEARTFVERAKGILQRDLKISEDAAYRVMQRESQERRRSMKEIAEAVIMSDGLRTSASAVAKERD
jgi:uroporphyrinogen-III synthase